jgi:hypothetical protein
MAKDNIFQQIATGRVANILKNDIITAREWFRQAAQKILNVNVYKLFEDNKKDLVKSINTSSIGSMFLFNYDPKTKDKLPYYDIFPLIFMIEIYNDGFLGINLHYLPPYYRAKLMNALYGITLKEGDKMKLQVSYRILKSAAKFRLFKPCVKRYLTSHVQSQFMFIEPEKWDIVLMLPTQRFVKASADQVWKDSVGMGR